MAGERLFGSPGRWRSILFVPGDRPDRFAKAMASGADAICIDLEDAVPAARKAFARAKTVRFISASRQGGGSGEALPPPAVVVRVNDLWSREGARDAAALGRDASDAAASARSLPGVAAFMLPKLSGTSGLDRARELLGSDVALLPLIETALGLEHAGDILRGSCETAEKRASASAATVGAVVFGGFDLSAELGCQPEWEPLLYARSRVIHAAALAGIPAFDMPSRDLGATDALRSEAELARRLGFSGKTAIHPSQIPVIHDVFKPSPEQVTRARRIVAADRAAEGGAAALDGKLVDKPVVDGARRLLARARHRS